MLYQTVSDPQQRIAKLTAKDPRRRRTSSGGSGLPIGGRRSRDEDVTEQRRTSFPGSPSSQRFGWSPTRPSGRVDDNSTAWGSPIKTPEDVSMESDAGGELEEGEHDVGPRVGTSDDETGEADVDTMSAAEVSISRPGVSSGGPTETASADEPELYSGSESDGVGGGVADGGKIEFDHGGSGGGGGDDGGDGGGGGGGGDAIGDEGVPVAPLDGGDDDSQHIAPDEQRPDSWLESPGTAAAPTWAGTSSSDDAESHGSARTEATTDENAPQTCTPSEVDDAATVPTYPPASARDDAVPGAAPGTSGIHIAGSSDTYVGGSSDTFFGGPSYTNVTVSTPMRTGEVPQPGGRSGDSDAGSTTVLAGDGPHSQSAPAVHVGGSTGPPTGDSLDAEQRSGTHDTGSAAVRGEDASGADVRMGNVDDTRVSGAPSRRITWGADETEHGPGGRRGVEEFKAQDANSGGGASHRPTVRMEGVRRDADQADGRLPGRNNQRMDEGGDSLLPETLHSSVESGGGAAALAASGVFDVTNTSSELEAGREGASVGDVDSLDGMGVHEPAWAQQHAVRDDEDRHTVEGRSGRIAAADDTHGLIEDLMRQVCSTRHKSAGLSRC